MCTMQPCAAKTVAMYDALVWELLHNKAPLPNIPDSNWQDQHLQLRHILGDLPMVPANYLVFPLYGR